MSQTIQPGTSQNNKMMELLNSIYKEQIQSLVMYNRLFCKVDQIEKSINQIGVVNNISTAVPLDDNFMSNWPMKNEQMFLNVE